MDVKETNAMDAKELFIEVIRQGGSCVGHIEAVELQNPTPCTEWNLQQLLNHMVYELLWVPDMLAGKTVAEVGSKYDGNVLGDNFHEAWLHAATKAVEAISKVTPSTTVHLSYADKQADDYIREVAGDILIHSWDADQSIGCSLRVEEPVAQAVHDYVAPRIEDYRKSEAVAAPVPVPNDAPIFHKLLGMMGRTPIPE
jgi:uncharacterized protein (TIGR03086 family)